MREGEKISEKKKPEAKRVYFKHLSNEKQIRRKIYMY